MSPFRNVPVYTTLQHDFPAALRRAYVLKDVQTFYGCQAKLSGWFKVLLYLICSNFSCILHGPAPIVWSRCAHACSRGSVLGLLSCIEACETISISRRHLGVARRAGGGHRAHRRLRRALRVSWRCVCAGVRGLRDPLACRLEGTVTS